MNIIFIQDKCCLFQYQSRTAKHPQVNNHQPHLFYSKSVLWRTLISFKNAMSWVTNKIVPYDKSTLKPIYQQACCKRIPMTGMWSSWRTVWSWKMSRTRLSLTGNLLPWSLTGGLISWSWIKHLLFQGVFDNIHNLHGDNDCCHPSVGALHNARIIFLVHFQGSIQGGWEVGGHQIRQTPSPQTPAWKKLLSVFMIRWQHEFEKEKYINDVQ